MVLDNVIFGNVSVLWMLAAMPVIAAIAFLSLTELGKARRFFSTTIRSICFTAGVIALADPVMLSRKTEGPRGSLIFVEDRSRSVSGEKGVNALKTQITAKIGDQRPRESIFFADRPWREGEPPANLNQTDIERSLDSVNERHLDLHGSDVVLFSDGRETRGSGSAAALRLTARGARVHVVPIGRTEARVARISAVEPSVDAKLGSATAVRISLAGSSNNTTVKLLDSNNQVIDARKLNVDGDSTLLLRFTPKAEGAQRYTVSLESDGQPSQSRPVTVFVASPPRLLVVDHFPDEVRAFEAALAPLKMPVDVITPEQFPTDLSRYAAVILSDLTGNEFSADQRLQIRRYVEDDTSGLVVVGGGNVVASRWRENPLSDLLPLRLIERPSKVVKKLPEVAVCFVIDSSGSMQEGLPGTTGDITKLELVKASVVASLSALPETASVAVIAFDDKPTMVVPPTSVSQKQAIGKNVDAIQVGGGTAIYPAVTEGLRVLSGMSGQKYIVVLTDGQSAPPPSGRWKDLTDSARTAGVTWTSVAVGGDADKDLLQKLATDAGGRFLFCGTGDAVPRVFIDQAKSIRRIAEIKQKPFTPKAGAQVADLGDISHMTFPDLEGSIPAEARGASRVQLLTEDGKPLLASWQFGAGRVVTFCSDIKPLWAKAWLDWPDFSRIWVRTVGSVAHARLPLRATVTSSQSGDTRTFTFHVTDEAGEPADRIETSVVSREGISSPKVTWNRRQPGTYEAAIRPPDDDKVTDVELLLSRKGQSSIHYIASVSGTSGSEMASTGPDIPSCRQIALAGSGIFATDLSLLAAELSRAPRPRTWTERRPLWPMFLQLMIVLWPVDVWARKSL